MKRKPKKRGDGKKTNVHHLFWESTHYQSQLERRFRGLECAKVVIDIRAHRLLNSLLPRGIPKPSQEQIEMFVAWHENGECSCYR